MLNSIQNLIVELKDDPTSYADVYKQYLITLQDELIQQELQRLPSIVHPTVNQIPKIIQDEFAKLQKLAGVDIC